MSAALGGKQFRFYFGIVAPADLLDANATDRLLGC